MDDHESIIAEAFERMDQLGISGPEACHVLIAGGLVALRWCCCDHALAEQMATVQGGIESLRAEWFN